MNSYALKIKSTMGSYQNMAVFCVINTGMFCLYYAFTVFFTPFFIAMSIGVDGGGSTFSMINLIAMVYLLGFIYVNIMTVILIGLGAVAVKSFMKSKLRKWLFLSIYAALLVLSDLIFVYFYTLLM